MPRSKDPRNYAQFYRDLAISMDAGVPEISLDTSGRNAIYIRNNFYGFVQACKHEAETITKHKGLPDSEKLQRVETALRMEEVMRGYMVMIDPVLKEQTDQSMADWPKAKLRFIRRDLDPRHEDLVAQLNTFMDEHKVLEPVAEPRKIERQITAGAFDFKAVDPGKMRGPDSPVAHFFKGVETQVEEDMTDKLADQILKEVPVDRSDLTDLITPNNQAEQKPPSYMEQALKGAEKLRKKEKE